MQTPAESSAQSTSPSLVSEQAAVSNDDSYTYIARQPIVDRQQHITGYELLSRATATSTEAPATHTRASDTAFLFNALSNISSENLFGDKLAFINVRLDDLSGEHFDIVHPERIVLELPRATSDDAQLIAEALPRMLALRERGFRLAAGTFAATAPYAAWLPTLSFLEVDVRALPVGVVPALMRKVEHLRNLKLIAEKVETVQAFREFFDAGFHLFQGYYFARPQTVSAKVFNPAYSTVLQLINLVNKQAEIPRIEEVLKRDPALSFKLLRYINSSGFGLMSEITSFRHAVMILGYKKLFRWLVLLMATTPGNSAASAIAGNAITRGRMMELLVQGSLSAEDVDNAFVVGVFSMLDVMLGVPLDKALEEISLSESITMALKRHHGIFGPYLQIVEACEQQNWMDVDLHISLLGLSRQRVTSSHLEALAWSDSLGI
ncbi:putative signal transduction protein containing EAL and modified HD-GYP domains [Thiomonas sp. X19]|uniref:EAL and HDOD domain-containing protein n=1 Tax=Thiomonas sp. X19 TaxID=1050370 RepID=UPI000B6C8CF7|nr:HDOD domain-containing protein [Thiomonas sp. X19]SCC91085.1 putative signal transduction protein containing EAL and modified HD-GYP domains [Thiomonas sp. X19]